MKPGTLLPERVGCMSVLSTEGIVLTDLEFDIRILKLSIHQELVVLVIPGYHVSMKSAVVTDWGVEGEPLA